MSNITHKYFVYSADNGFEVFATAAQAEQVAEDIINQYREDAYEDGWDDDVESVCWGEVSKFSAMAPRSPLKLDERGVSGCDYALKGFE